MIDTSLHEFLRTAIGLKADSIGQETIDSALQQRMRACGARNCDEYLDRLRTTPDETEALIEVVVVPETWFFRHAESFTALVDGVQRRLRKQLDTGVLRILSVPCSTGEEPYSIAMALLDAGIAADKFIVDAVDISRQALDRAARGIYGGNSFRSEDLSFRDRYFQRGAGGYRIADAARRPVRFRRDNIVSPAFLAGCESYDMIFCRNVLIYFDDESQERAIHALERNLKPEGLLFAGPAEGFLLIHRGFRSTRHRMAFAYCKAELPRASDHAAVIPQRQVRPAAKRMRDSRTPPPVLAPRLAVTTSKPEPASPDSLETARRLADAGELQQALQMCETCLNHNQPSADAFYLQALLYDSMGDHKRAEDSYRKTLYLNPEHEDALSQLILLAESKGRSVGPLKERMGRLSRLSRQ